MTTTQEPPPQRVAQMEPKQFQKTAPPTGPKPRLTKQQHEFHNWLNTFGQTCRQLGGRSVEIGIFHTFEFLTRLGPLRTTACELDYEDQIAHGWVEINSRFTGERDIPAMQKFFETTGTDYNQNSSKWNINYSGSKADIATTRTLALDELKRRIGLVAPETKAPATTPLLQAALDHAKALVDQAVGHNHQLAGQGYSCPIDTTVAVVWDEHYKKYKFLHSNAWDDGREGGLMQYTRPVNPLAFVSAGPQTNHGAAEAPSHTILWEPLGPAPQKS